MELKTKMKLLLSQSTSNKLSELIKKAEIENSSYEQLLNNILDYEMNARKQKSISTKIKKAEFPYVKTLNNFELPKDFGLNQREINQLAELNWMTECYNLILLGASGVGKTHLAIALGVKAIEKGHKVSFISMGDLIHTLKTKSELTRERNRAKKLETADLIIIDDMMYLAMNEEEANIFFHFINKLYEKSSIILTSNRSPEEWIEKVGKIDVISAILDRMLHRSEIIQFNTKDSWRLKHRKTIFGINMEECTNKTAKNSQHELKNM